MTKKLMLAAAAALSSSLMAGTAAYAAPVYLGVSINGGAITQVATGSGSASYNNTLSGFAINASVEGTPPLPEPDLLSNEISVSSTSATGTIMIYATETNQFPIVGGFASGFSNNPLSTVSVTEATYAQNCTGGNNNPCLPADVFNTTNLLASGTMIPGATNTIDSAFPASITGGTVPYSETEVFTITFTALGQTSNATIDLVAVPEPASLALVGLGLLGLGLVRRRRPEA